MTHCKKFIILIAIIILSIGTGQIEASANEISDSGALEENRLVVFEAFMRPT